MEDGRWEKKLENTYIPVLPITHCLEKVLYLGKPQDRTFRYPLPITHHPSPITHHPSPITHHPSPITHYPLPITHHPLPSPPSPVS